VWERFNDNGVLDSKSLAGFIATPYKWEIFKQLKEDDYNDTVVTLLIDNSGSMRGIPIATAAVISDLLAKTLDTLQIKTEVVGYTTANWKGGKSFAKWLNAGSPLQPGRLGELRHIIYKQAYCSWRKAKRNFGLMIKEGILKENIDGEALKWAAKRILAMPQQRKILVVISDGVPLDEATIANNPNNYLGLHLSHIIAKIERMPVRLFAIGIGHDISGFYKNFLKIENHEVLGKALFEKLAELIVA
jgi:cobaltochelatase CobT